MLHVLRRLFALGLIGAASAAAAAVSPQPIPPEATGPADGWFFYDDPAPETPVEKPRPKPPTPGNGISLGADTPLSAAWLRENLPKFLDRATDNPSIENVQLYMHLQKVAMDKAEAFSQTQRVAVALDETIDESVRSPISGFGKAAKEEAKSAARQAVLKALSRRAGIWYFYRSDCQYCLRQSPLLHVLEERIGVAILPISMDGLPMPDGSYPNYVVDDGHSAQLNVTVTPTMFLSDGKDIFPLATGLRALPEIEERMLTVAHKAGWIDADTYAEATGSNLAPTVDLSKPPSSSDPGALLAYLRELNGLGSTPVRRSAPSIPNGALP